MAKILTPLGPDDTAWTVLRSLILPSVDHLHVVLSPAVAETFDAGPPALSGGVSVGVQAEPTGMGDAIFGARPVWSAYDCLVVVWGDQVNLSSSTVDRALAAHGGEARRMVLPVVELAQPYVEYEFDGQGHLTRVLQSREGDRCSPGGYGDVGTFVFSTGGLAAEWERYCRANAAGSNTGERNLLPFFVHLDRSGWTISRVEVEDPVEAMGINTPDELAQTVERRARRPKGPRS